jgi:hypothetical protein
MTGIKKYRSLGEGKTHGGNGDVPDREVSQSTQTRKVGSFDPIAFTKSYLECDEESLLDMQDGVDKLIRNVELNGELALAQLLKCYDERYYLRYLDLLVKILVAIYCPVVDSIDTYKIVYSGCDFDLKILRTTSHSQNILSIRYKDGLTMRNSFIDGKVEYDIMVFDSHIRTTIDITAEQYLNMIR